VDVGVVDPEAKPGAIVALTGSDTAVYAREGDVKKEPLTVRPRRLWVKRPGATEASWAVQLGQATYWAADADEIVTFGDRLLAAGAFALVALVEPILPVSASAARLRGAARLRAGDPAGALEHLAAAVEMKKAPADTWWYLADALHSLGREDEARPHLERFLAKSGKRAAHVLEAKRRLEG
jgi:tetratricopeptide (TPR) repeat protein